MCHRHSTREHLLGPGSSFQHFPSNQDEERLLCSTADPRPGPLGPMELGGVWPCLQPKGQPLLLTFPSCQVAGGTDGGHMMMVVVQLRDTVCINRC